MKLLRRDRPSKPVTWLSPLFLSFLSVVLPAVVVLAAACGGSTSTTTSPTTSTTTPTASTAASSSTTGGTSSTQPESGSSTSSARVTLPDTPAGRQAQWLIDATAHLPISDAEVRAHFDATFLAQVSPEMLNQAIQGATEVELVSIETNQPDLIVIIVSSGGGLVQVSLAVDSDGLIGGLHLGPATPPTTYAPYQPPGYVDQAAFVERSVTVGAGTEWALPGTLTLPKGDGPFPAVVLVQGSGPSDRDETIGPNKPFRDLAWGLASQGIAVLRYDKRTYVYPQKVDPSTITLEGETIDDAVAAARLLRDTPEVDTGQIYVLGHSLGATAAPRIGKQDPSLAGLIMLAGATRPLEDVILDQVKYIDSLNGGPTPAQEAQFEILEAQVDRVKDPDLSPSTPPGELPLGINAHYWLDLRAYEPAEVAAGLDMRLAVLQGGRDYQVTEADFDGWQSGLRDRPDAKLVFYSDLNHEFVTGTGKATPAEYELVGHVAEKVIDDLAAWIKG